MGCAARGIAVACFAGYACGGSSSPVGTAVSGTIDGRTFDAKDAIATQATGSGFTFGGPATYVEITDYAGACAKETAHLQPATGQRLVLGLASYDSSGHSGAPSTSGTFVVTRSGPGAPGSKSRSSISTAVVRRRRHTQGRP